MTNLQINASQSKKNTNNFKEIIKSVGRKDIEWGAFALILEK